MSKARNAGDVAFPESRIFNPLWRSCASKAQNAGDAAFAAVPAQPSAEIVRNRACRRHGMRVKLLFCMFPRLLGHMAHEVHIVSGTVCG